MVVSFIIINFERDAEREELHKTKPAKNKALDKF
jgi:hypothetical protein